MGIGDSSTQLSAAPVSAPALMLCTPSEAHSAPPTGRLAKEGKRAKWETRRFEIVDMDGRTIDKVLASRLDPNAPESTDEAAAP